MMKENNNLLTLGYNLDIWNSLKLKIPITTETLPTTNSHMIISGMSGSGKTFAQQQIFAKLAKKGGLIYFADFKGDDSYKYLQGCPRYYFYNKTINALYEVYAHFQSRVSGSSERYPISLIWDEYVANMLALQGEDKKKAAEAMTKVAEILQLGRSLGVRLIQSCQR
ncbi:MAG: type IV secretory system conjugative DNA transfer family protein, partial [Clostridiales bacterium]|nr:type IV secretory system conjugative DNA transfer family protein [Clostridiales bacterium]